jgi:hypothetical protein
VRASALKFSSVDEERGVNGKNTQAMILERRCHPNHSDRFIVEVLR